jgi:hypothetical protein
MGRADQRRLEFGDWQTPAELCNRVLDRVAARFPSARSVVEPNCGAGAFLAAATRHYPDATLHGFDISEPYLQRAREVLGARAQLTRADFFELDWDAVLQELPQPILVVGNPPWVTNSRLGVFASKNLPEKRNSFGARGLEAKTGKSNFDISEWMVWRLVNALRQRDYFLAMLVKSTVARRLMQHVSHAALALEGSTHWVDARAHFDASVDAVLLTLRSGADTSVASWAVFDALDADSPARHMGVVDGRLSSDLGRFHRTRALEGRSSIEWRSGIKHDCAAVMELVERDGTFRNKHGERVDIEEEYVFPLLKSSDLAKGRVSTHRRVIVPQSTLAGDTSIVKERAPKTWAYLDKHRAKFEARKSSIYRGQPAFALFGVGEYSFRPHKVAISGLYKSLTFNVVEPIAGRPTMLDDTCYFLPCESREQAEALARHLNGDRAREFFEARIFWDAKRPVNKALLSSLCLESLSEL